MSESDSKNTENSAPEVEQKLDNEPDKKRSFLQRFRRQKPVDFSEDSSGDANAPDLLDQEQEVIEPPITEPKETMRSRFRRALSKTGRSFGNLFLGDREIDDELLEELETLLLLADVGIESTVEIIQDLAERVKRRELADSRALFMALQNAMVDKLSHCEQPLVLGDQKGRLHTKSNLMEELKKVKRVMTKLDDSAPHEVLLVLDAGTGQNAVNQMQEFNETVAVTGVVLTKLDGTAKGGIVFSLCKRFGIPVRFVGLGESVEDLQPFSAREYVYALFDNGSK